MLHPNSVQTNDADRIIYGFIIVEFFGSLCAVCTWLRKRLLVQTPVSASACYRLTMKNKAHTKI